ncbi:MULTISPECIES: 5-methyltetrahydropteroyltriglutamate--homocysteine S-methyltransferase [unclassified Lysobacter]|uniref:5-methyltetrahydropteroyltriglutamate-- homocysteine S-methyltransferase n=1 Tax=unclassified Lysobacter TaxID=2635362 RepID=UPI001BEBCC48|nr:MULTISPECIES: 5-methyltetrahydropteroyltriglutamate--homocysteine S-methyltransferase [unclassified Lysobacter]MBT2748841.1 5-methyltetrahydropteroyltriglutamate--homocysteine S-methyltransferase [Lysobacter sp. ISL-42]MBT2751112.1 5-methyltetrahydropteroyltriglutamate--homocysteine S-methyltransferase [Lysobacter sp. ISL-50]MBT2779658.1 5-methyltetrahydropteroyltriglutamate--homocysteine S-methyltransferase [Lysobacter sp. ISL-54]MBT2783428.1 5-methyltetrahydropteroyltriglutamate--homocyste
MISVTPLGFPRIGARRELKQALESFWKGDSDARSLHATAAALRERHWRLAREAGADIVPVNDFSLYDHVLDTSVLFDAIPASHRAAFDEDPLSGYFALARGLQDGRRDLRALEMTKWFDTNYHYLVPQFEANQRFALRGDKPLAELTQAQALGLEARPVLLGPVSLLKLGKRVDGGDPRELLDHLLPAYAELLSKLKAAGAQWVQIDEPALVLDLDDADRAAYRRAYAALAEVDAPQRLLTTYFGALGDNATLAAQLPVEGLHLDLVRAPQQLESVLPLLPEDRALSLGVVDGRNIWRADLDAALSLARRAGARAKWLAPSCSLLHVPADLELEKKLPTPLKHWMAYARQKIEELRLLADALAGNADAERDLAAAASARAARLASPLLRNAGVRKRLAAVEPAMANRVSPYPQRARLQQERLNLPLFPTTTIGSFPQTAQVRRARAEHKAGKIDDDAYRSFLENETVQCLREQEALGIDVLVHGEFERNDMVEYFGEQLDGFAFTAHGWVQSYGSRCVKPPVLFGDVSRPRAMTVDWTRYAQSQTDRPVKGMLTGPVTILQWSFVRDDQPRADSCRQIALALREEVLDLESAGIAVIQIDEPALREGLPLRRADWPAYLAWAGESFRLAASGVGDATQIHTHMCYAEFNDIIDAVAALDADVISIETSRSRMELLDAFARYRYPNGIGPGVYDIHSPRVPSRAEMSELLDKALDVLEPAQLWVNPDCGLKTRGWPEVRAALQAMVQAAQGLREQTTAEVS